MGKKAKVAERGQVTIPKVLRDRLGIRSGTTLVFDESDGRLIVTKADLSDPVDQIYGTLGKDKRSTDDIINELRGEA